MPEQAANGLVADFLEFIYENFPFLNPYEKLAFCKHNKELLDNRCRLAMEEITPGRVDYRPGWGYYMRFHGGPSQDVKLDAEGAGAGLKILLSLHPGETQNQTKKLYSALSVERLFELQTKGWQVVPHFHFAFRQDDLFHSKGTISLMDYIAFWQKSRDLIHQMPLGPQSEFGEIFEKYVELLTRKGIISENETADIFKVTIQTKRPTINVCPGVSLFYRWELSNAINLDRRDLFVDNVRAPCKKRLMPGGKRYSGMKYCHSTVYKAKSVRRRCWTCIAHSA